MCHRCGKAHHSPARQTKKPRRQPDNEMLMLQRLPAPQPPRVQTALLHDPRVSGQIRRSVAQAIGQQHGNAYLQRMLLQRQADPMLRAGSKGADVERLQQMLIDCGASITPDGMFGPKTRQAVIAFQQAAGMAADGIVGPQTWTKLNSGGITIPATGGGSSPASQLVLAKLQEVKQLMKQLAQSGKTATHGNTQTATTTGGIALNSDSEDGEASWWDKAKEVAGDAANSVSEAAGNAWDSTKEAAGDAWDTAKEAAGDAWDTAKDVAGTAGEIVGGIVDDAKQKTGEIVQGIQEKVNKGIDTVVQGVSEVAKDVGSSVEEFTSDLREKYASEIAAVQEFVNDVKHYLEHPEDALRKLEEILGGLKKKAAELFRDEPGSTEPDTLTGTLDPVEVRAETVICHDEKSAPPLAPGMRRLKVNPSFDMSTEQTDTLPEGTPLNSDSLRPRLDYVGVTTMNDDNIVTVPAGDFGSTGATIKIDSAHWTAERFTDYVTMSARLLHQISYAITDRPGRENVPPDLSNIDETNWQAAADDLDPDVEKTGFGAPRRGSYWAKDITEQHEQFHVKDGDDYVKDKVVPALQADMATKVVDVPVVFFRETNIKKQLHAITEAAAAKARDMRNTYMGKPGVETRTYAVDESKYRARAAAIRKKAADQGWSKKKP